MGTDQPVPLAYIYRPLTLCFGLSTGHQHHLISPATTHLTFTATPTSTTMTVTEIKTFDEFKQVVSAVSHLQLPVHISEIQPSLRSQRARPSSSTSSLSGAAPARRSRPSSPSCPTAYKASSSTSLTWMQFPTLRRKLASARYVAIA